MKDFTYVVPNLDAEDAILQCQRLLLQGRHADALAGLTWYLAKKEAQEHVDKAIVEFIEAVKKS